MLPNNVLSSIDMVSPILGARSKVDQLFYDLNLSTVDYDDGGIGLNDPSQGLFYQEWKGEIIDNAIVLSAPVVIPTVVYIGLTGFISEISFTFDQNMRPAVAFVEEGQSKLMWFDSALGGNVVDNIPGSFPRLFLDDKRPNQNKESDIILGYVLSNNLCMRMQRDRFKIEYVLKTGVTGRFITIGMGANLRLQFPFTYA
jgi:hypothetical protein